MTPAFPPASVLDIVVDVGYVAVAAALFAIAAALLELALGKFTRSC